MIARTKGQKNEQEEEERRRRRRRRRVSLLFTERWRDMLETHMIIPKLKYDSK